MQKDRKILIPSALGYLAVYEVKVVGALFITSVKQVTLFNKAFLG